MARATDDLLAEYMRVINSKDAEVLDLMSRCERLETEKRKKEERYRQKLADLKAAMTNADGAAKSAEGARAASAVELAQLQRERDDLVSDVRTLQHALQRQEDHMRGILKANSKAQRKELQARDDVEREGRESQRLMEVKAQAALDRIGVLETQLTSAQGRVLELEESAHRGRAEVRGLKEALEKREQHTVDLRAQLRDMVPRSQAAAEVQQAETRREQAEAGLKGELQRLRAELMGEASAAGRKDAALAQSAADLRKAEGDLRAARRRAEEAEASAAREAAEAAQRAELSSAERAEVEAALRERLAAADENLARTTGDLAVARQRADDLDAAARISERHWRDLEQDFDADATRLRTQLDDARREAEAAARHGAETEGALRALREKFDRWRQESTREVQGCRDAVGDTERALSKAQERAAGAEQDAASLRRELGEAQAGAAAERREAAGREEKLRDMVAALQRDLQRSVDGHAAEQEEASGAAARYDAEMRREKERASREVAALDSALQQCREEMRQHQQRGEATAALLAERSAAAEAAGVELLEARSATRAADAKIVDLGLQLAERDASLGTQRRTVEALESELDNANRKLDAAREEALARQAENDALRVEVSSVRTEAQGKDLELADVRKQTARAETAASRQAAESEEETRQVKARLQRLSSDLQEAEQRLVVAQVERTRLEAKHAEECGVLNRDVVAPLQEKVTLLAAANQRLEDTARNTEARLLRAEPHAARWTEAEPELQDLRSRVRALGQASDDAKRLGSTVDAQRGELEELRAANHRYRAEAEAGATKDAQLHARLQAKEAEASALQERLADTESLRRIAEQQLRERADQLDDATRSLAVLQSCYDKQQSQLEAGQRMRDHDLSARERRFQ